MHFAGPQWELVSSLTDYSQATEQREALGGGCPVSLGLPSQNTTAWVAELTEMYLSKSGLSV